jgi:NAD(P)H-dependent FMN reductase
VIVGSVREDRSGIRVARFIHERCRVRGHVAELIDPAEHRLPLLNKMYKEFPASSAPPTLEHLAELLNAADAYIVVTAEYNHAAPPALTNLLDHFQEEYLYKPSGIVSYSAGRFGGVRAAVALRAMLAELGMSSIPSTLAVPNVSNQFDADGTPKADAWNQRAADFLAEFEWYAMALRDARIRSGSACPARARTSNRVASGESIAASAADLREPSEAGTS